MDIQCQGGNISDDLKNMRGLFYPPVQSMQGKHVIAPPNHVIIERYNKRFAIFKNLPRKFSVYLNNIFFKYVDFERIFDMFEDF